MTAFPKSQIVNRKSEMTKAQRITLMADWWPRACRAQGWDAADRAKRLAVLSAAVGRPLATASELNSTIDIDKVKAHLGFLCDNIAATRETLADGEAVQRARRLRFLIREKVRQLDALLETGRVRAAPSSPGASYLAAIIADKFQHGSRAEPLTLDQLTAAPLPGGRRSQLDQLLITLTARWRAHQRSAAVSVPGPAAAISQDTSMCISSATNEPSKMDMAQPIAAECPF